MSEEKKNEKKNEKKRGRLPTQMNLMIHIVAGGYLVYLAYSIYGEIKTAEGAGNILIPIAGILFAAVGAVIVISALRSWIKGEYEGGAGDPDRKNSEVSEESAEEAETEEDEKVESEMVEADKEEVETEESEKEEAETAD